MAARCVVLKNHKNHIQVSLNFRSIKLNPVALILVAFSAKKLYVVN